MQVIYLCTGNAARSVMAGAVHTAHRPDDAVITAGTHVVDGQPPSWRTRDSLTDLGYDASTHRSAQLRAVDLPTTDVVVAMANEHVEWMRRTHPEAADRTVTLHRLVKHLVPGDDPFTERLARLDAAGVALEAWEEVVDPAGGELDTYQACAREVDDLVRRFLSLI